MTDHPSRRSARLAGPLVVVLALLAAAAPAAAIKRDTLKLHTKAGVRTINVEITETQEEKAKGLMFRTHLEDTDSMLFFYERPIEITMWMRNTLIPLDMVFIRPDRRPRGAPAVQAGQALAPGPATALAARRVVGHSGANRRLPQDP
jgi:hypothetical protein